MKTRMDLDFTKHEYLVSKPDDNVAIYELKIPGTRMHQFTFINACGILAVTGDYGNWVFCREFHPAAGDHADDYYWLEKLHTGSEQRGEEYDSDKTLLEIQERLDGLEEYGYTGKRLHEMREYLKECLDHVHLSEHEYTSFAFNNFPGFLDAENVPFCRSIVPRLLFVFDAYDEMCRRAK